MTDSRVTILVRKWCPYHGHPFCAVDECMCPVIASAVHEALEEAEQIARAEEGASWDVGTYCGCPEKIADAIAALREAG